MLPCWRAIYAAAAATPDFHAAMPLARRCCWPPPLLLMPMLTISLMPRG